MTIRVHKGAALRLFKCYVLANQVGHFLNNHGDTTSVLANAEFFLTKDDANWRAKRINDSLFTWKVLGVRMELVAE